MNILGIWSVKFPGFLDPVPVAPKTNVRWIRIKLKNGFVEV